MAIASQHLNLAEERFRLAMEVPPLFFKEHADILSQACFAMAQRFHRGGRLMVFGTGSSVSDAQHVAVEFVHPVIVGKRALPALALTNDAASILGFAGREGLQDIFARQLQLLGTSDDIAMGLTCGGNDDAVANGLAMARDMGMLTIAMHGGEPAAQGEVDYRFTVPSCDSYVIQEVQETAYHILWETVHIFFEHQGLLEG